MILYWLTQRSGGSIIPAVLLHSATNVYSTLLESDAIFAGTLSLYFTEFKTVA